MLSQSSNTVKVIIAVIVLILVGLGGFYLGRQSVVPVINPGTSGATVIPGNPRVSPTPITETTRPEPEIEEGNQVACTMDAKICPDGSAVGRTGPNCEFAPCP